MLTDSRLAGLAQGFDARQIGNGLIIHADCFQWLEGLPQDSLHGIVTDPPYGVKEFEDDQLSKRANGKGGIWRIPPSFDGSIRSPLPRFTALLPKDRVKLHSYFVDWAKLVTKVLRPGGHVMIAGNAYLSQLVWSALVEGGLEFRGEIIRLVSTLRGGDRPKGAHEEFPGVTVIPRGGYEPWGLFRKPIPDGMTVAECLREWQTGGLRRPSAERPFIDVIPSERTPERERMIANHPSLKPQSLLRQLTYAILPLGEGIICDPFAGSGSTVAAANAVGLTCIGVERLQPYYEMSLTAIPRLTSLDVDWPGSQQQLPLLGDYAR